MLHLEHTHNMGGGTLYALDAIDDMCHRAHDRGLKVHMDGARIFNASAASGHAPARIAAKVDTVMFCLSKALGAPVGSIVAGPARLIQKGRLLRKRLGGGMRQVGVLAAAGLVALEQSPGCLKMDHANAQLLARRLQEIDGVTVRPVETNIVIFDLPEGEIEVGIGIHGEPGRRRVPLASAHEIADVMVEAVVSDLKPAEGTKVLVFTNGMGSTPQLELYLLHGEIERGLRAAGVEPVRRLVGSYITSLDMAGASLTLLALDDEDHGTNMNRGFDAVEKALAGQNGDVPPGRLLVLAGKTLVSTVGGASGPLWGSALRAAGRTLGDAESFDGPALAAALDAAIAAVVGLGAASPGDKTMIDALTPASEALRRELDSGASIGSALVAAGDAAEEGARATVPMLARKGRASYLGERPRIVRP